MQKNLQQIRRPKEKEENTNIFCCFLFFDPHPHCCKLYGIYTYISCATLHTNFMPNIYTANCRSGERSSDLTTISTRRMTHHWQHEHQYQLNSSSRSFAFSFVMLFYPLHPVVVVFVVVVFLFFFFFGGNLEIVDRACLALQSDITNVPQRQHWLVMSIFVAAFPPLPHSPTVP